MKIFIIVLIQKCLYVFLLTFIAKFMFDTKWEIMYIALIVLVFIIILELNIYLINPIEYEKDYYKGDM